MKTEKELDDLNQRIYWALEHGRMREARLILTKAISEEILQDRYEREKADK